MKKNNKAHAYGRISLECENCGIEYETYAAWARKRNHHFCSPECYHEKSKIQINYKCVVCGKIFTASPSFFVGSNGERNTRVESCSDLCKKINSKNQAKHASNMAIKNNLKLVKVTKIDTGEQHEFIGSIEAAKFIGCAASSVSNCINGNRSSVFGFRVEKMTV